MKCQKHVNLHPCNGICWNDHPGNLHLTITAFPPSSDMLKKTTQNHNHYCNSFVLEYINKPTIMGKGGFCSRICSGRHSDTPKIPKMNACETRSLCEIERTSTYLLHAYCMWNGNDRSLQMLHPFWIQDNYVLSTVTTCTIYR